MKEKKLPLFLTLLMFLFGAEVWAQPARIVVEAMSPERLREQRMTTNISSGLTTVPRGAYVYLSAQPPAGATFVSVAWTLLSRPVGSTAVFDSATARFTTIRLDSAGQYVVGARITSSVGVKDTTVTLTAANFVGIGSVGGRTPSVARGHCAACHRGQLAGLKDVVTPWSQSAHATMFKRGLDGQIPRYGSACITCHTTGYDATARNSNFADLMRTSGYTFPATLRAGNFDSLAARHPDLAQVATIGCESCHGPGSLHFADPKKIGQTMESGVCAQCHDQPWRYNRVAQYNISEHANPPWSASFRQAAAAQNNNLHNCVRCHDGQGYVNFTIGKTTDTSPAVYDVGNHTKITCQTCHEPHSGGLRSAPISSDTLSTGFRYTDVNWGSGKMCVNCHKYRRAEFAFIGAAVTGVGWGPHYGGAADVMLGQNGHTFGVPIASSIAHRMVENSCVGCHMSATPDTGKVGRDKIGDHTWKMRYTIPGGTEVHNVSGCVSCHSGITKFDDIRASIDYDLDGTTEAFMTEVEGMLKRVAMALPPFGSETIDRRLIAAHPDSVRLKRAFWNYLYVSYGSGKGVHNPKYVVGLLQRTLLNVTGVEVVSAEIPETFALSQNYPNPFNPTTQIQFNVPRESKVQILVYDILGRKVKTLVENIMPPGTYKATWDGRDDNGNRVASGVYLYRLVAEDASGGAGQDFVLTKKMILLK